MKWFFGGLYDYRVVLVQLVRLQLTLRYHRTALGFLWTLINPLLNMAVLAIVFSTVMHMPVKNFAVYLFAGVIPWTLFSTTLSQCAWVLIAKESIIKKIYLPKQLFVASTAIGLLIDSLLSTVCLFLIAMALGAPMTLSLLFLPVSFLLLAIFSFGLGLMLSIITVFVRDMQNIITALLQALYFMTPIIYPITQIPEQYRVFFQLNPMYYFLDVFRQPISNGVLPSWHSMGMCSVLALTSLLLGIWIFKANDRKIIFRL
ncbi:ABC transporter permease [Aquirhabdus parva]|uniref:Transport permease protein n=1 Tax=Aquirhabdus parva TaxID=2283318 RepID=A0A345P8H9_9GAMM|nr:ABC transporter permease [Aquirhabdus parva]AXI03588.1 ABC transporter permease [Aquirhabdus parva]